MHPHCLWEVVFEVDYLEYYRLSMQYHAGHLFVVWIRRWGNRKRVNLGHHFRLTERRDRRQEKRGRNSFAVLKSVRLLVEVGTLSALVGFVSVIVVAVVVACMVLGFELFVVLLWVFVLVFVV